MKKSFIKRLVALALVIVSVLSVSAVALADSDITGTYNDTAVKFYRNPNGSVIGWVNKNSTCTIHGYRSVSSVIWYKVTILTGDSELNGDTGWSKASCIDVTGNVAVPLYTYDTIEEAFGAYDLENGDSGTYVRNLQVCLKAKGNDISVDGDFGPATEAAVRAFQTSKGLKSDGIVGDDTKDALLKDSTCLAALNSSGY